MLVNEVQQLKRLIRHCVRQCIASGVDQGKFPEDRRSSNLDSEPPLINAEVTGWRETPKVVPMAVTAFWSDAYPRCDDLEVTLRQVPVLLETRNKFGLCRRTSDGNHSS